MKAGDRVVCIDDKNPVPLLIKEGEIYEIESTGSLFGVPYVFLVGNPVLLDADRFRKVEDDKASFTNKLTKELANKVVKELEMPEIEKVKEKA